MGLGGAPRPFTAILPIVADDLTRARGERQKGAERCVGSFCFASCAKVPQQEGPNGYLFFFPSTKVPTFVTQPLWFFNGMIAGERKQGPHLAM